MARGPLGAERRGANLAPTVEIPDKLYFKIGEVARLVGVQPHVLRYWEKEVPGVRPVKSASQQRRYRRRDVELFREARRLLHEERYTLAGVRKRLGSKSARRAVGSEADAPAAAGMDADAADAAALDATRLDATRLGRVRQHLLELIRLAEADTIDTTDL